MPGIVYSTGMLHTSKLLLLVRMLDNTILLSLESIFYPQQINELYSFLYQQLILKTESTVILEKILMLLHVGILLFAFCLIQPAYPCRTLLKTNLWIMVQTTQYANIGIDAQSASVGELTCIEHTFGCFSMWTAWPLTFEPPNSNDNNLSYNRAEWNLAYYIGAMQFRCVMCLCMFCLGCLVFKSLQKLSVEYLKGFNEWDTARTILLGWIIRELIFNI